MNPATQEVIGRTTKWVEEQQVFLTEEYHKQVNTLIEHMLKWAENHKHLVRGVYIDLRGARIMMLVREDQSVTVETFWRDLQKSLFLFDEMVCDQLPLINLDTYHPYMYCHHDSYVTVWEKQDE